jgi:hypothetical protein
MKAKKITTDNYFETIEEIGFENLPLVLKQSHTVIMTKTDNGRDWEKYKSDADLKRMINLVFKKLEDFIRHGEKEELSGTENSKEKTKKKNPYAAIREEVSFIQRFLQFHDKILYKNTFEIFIDDLQKAIKEKLITKKSPVVKDILAIQQASLNAFNTMKNAKYFVLKATTIKHLKSIIEKYENAYEDIDKTYVKVKKKKMDLSGIETEKVNVMPSTDFASMQFDSIGFTGKWLDFIGDPPVGFTAMVFGMPKMGKSYLCVDFAGYLARNHGTVLYVAKEEKLDATLQKKLKDKEVAHENLFVSDALPKDLSAYDYIFLDSVNKLELSPKDLTKLKTDNKGKSFIFVFQATKGGKFKGNNEFQHDVDVVIEVPEQGKAVQFGRFNQGGELDIFPDSASDSSEENETALEGLDGKEKKEKRYSKHEEIPDISEPYFNDFSKKGWDGVPKAVRKEIMKGVPDAAKIINYKWIDLKPALKQKILDFHFGWRVESNRKNKEQQSLAKKQKPKKADWTEPEYMDASDHWTLKKIKKFYDEGDMSSAMETAMNADTAIREEIPGDIWKKMGGQLTPSGEEKLKKKRKLLSPSSEKSIAKETELGIPLEELAIEMKLKKNHRDGIIDLIYDTPEKVEKIVKILVEKTISDDDLKIKVKSVEFKENDSDKLSSGASYYTIVLEGAKSELKKIAGEEKLFYCEW